MKSIQLIFYLLIIGHCYAQVKMNDSGSIYAYKTDDFEISGDGESGIWKSVNWIEIEQRVHLENKMQTKVKVLYSKNGIYFLFYNEDPKLDATFEENGAHLWLEDVVEVFIWPDTSHEYYFEYELSPLNYDLPLMVMNFGGKPHRWEAWYYEDDRQIKHKTAVQGGNKKSGAIIKSWTAEFFIPYSLLSPMLDKTPKNGDKWRVNFNRMDYLNKKEIYWSWQDLPGSFHDMNKFGTLIFK